jgi:alpha-galactosidase
MKIKAALIIRTFLVVIFLSVPLLAETVYVDSLDLTHIFQGFGPPGVKTSVGGTPITLGGRVYERGFGTHALSGLRIELDGQARSFSAVVGIDDGRKESKAASVKFVVVGDGKRLFDSGVLRAGETRKVEVDLLGVETLVLVVYDGGDGMLDDHADWGDARIEMIFGKPRTVPAVPRVAREILTPPAVPQPRINSARVFGTRPGSPFLFRVAASGERPMTFSADKLPAGLKIDSASGIITGKLTTPGEHLVTLKAVNKLGAATQQFKIVAGNDLALTPPMGWNSWYCWNLTVNQNEVERAGKGMVESGLVNHGWTYINIDDGWEGVRGGPLNSIQPNERFPDMKKLCDSLHALGLKAGIYSSPGPKTCGGYLASYEHEAEDAKQWAEWGFDYLKHDWCSYAEVVKGQTGLEVYQKPYRLMADLLRKQGRDMVLSLCQYGMGDVSKWGYEVGGQLWRTTGDMEDSWAAVNVSLELQAPILQNIRPGGWNDPDMLMIGEFGPDKWRHPTRLTSDEQYTQFSLWCMMSAPLLLSCDLEHLDTFTLNLLTNDEVIAVDQDPAGLPAVRHQVGDALEVWTKPLSDGSTAVALVNRGFIEEPVTANWKDLGLADAQKARDLWRQKDLGSFEQQFQAPIRPRGVVLLRVQPAGAR